ncbi:MAG TPA: GNAT family N-acetyltransferase [Smithellaceae bacterium]|nr:GNAT family N-acetyltransferase [Smithellaceae bacterium]
MKIVQKIEADFRAAAIEFGRLSSLSSQSGAILTMTSGIAVDDLNWIWNKKSLTPDHNNEITKLKNHFRGLSLPFWWWVYPGGQSATTKKILQEQEFRFLKEVPCLAARLNASPGALSDQDKLEAVTINAVACREDLLLWELLSFRGFAMPRETEKQYSTFVNSWNVPANQHLRLFNAYAHGKPAASGLLLFHGKTAGIYFLSVLPECRGRGIGLALTAALLQYARKKDYQLCVLQSSEEGFSVYQRAGFRHYCSADIYVPADQL